MYYHPSSESLLLPHKHNLHRPSPQSNPPKMCTPWTLRRLLVGHQAKEGRHLNLSRSPFQLEDDPNKPIFTTTEQPNNAQPSSSTRQDRAATALVSRFGCSRNNEAPLAASRVSVVKRGKHKRKVTIGSNHTSSSSSSLGDGGGGGAAADEADWPPFTDEDYIVFCFEEDGEFHVVMDENSKPQDCSDHGHSPRPFNQKVKVQGDNDYLHSNDNMDDNSMNRRDCFLPNKAIEEERFYFSPRLQSDGIKSHTRFKAELDDEDMKVAKARGRVDEEMDYEDMDGIKRRGECNVDEQAGVLCEDEDLECHKASMECRDGSVESTSSSQSGWVRQLQVTKTDQEIGLGSSSPRKNKTGDDEESIYLSSESQGGSQGEDETSDTSELEEDEEAALDSAKSKCSISSSSSFEFPVLQLDWIGSPVKWPKSKSIRLRKPKSRRVCLRCCRF